MSCSVGTYLLLGQCLSACPGGVYGEKYWPNVHNQTCDPLTITNILNLNRIELGRTITEFTFYGLFIPLVALKQGSQLWLLWDSFQTLYLYSFLNPKYLPYELFWVLDSFGFSMLAQVPSIPSEILNYATQPVDQTEPISNMSMFVLKQTPVYFLSNAGGAVFILCIWVCLCYIILFPIETAFKLCKCSKLLAVFSWFNLNWRVNVLLRLLLQLSPVFIFYCSFQLFFTQFDDNYFLSNYIIGLFFLVFSWLGAIAFIYYIRNASAETKPVQAEKPERDEHNTNLQIDNSNQEAFMQPATTLIDGFSLLKRYSKYFYLYSMLLKSLTAIFVVVLYQDQNAIPQLAVNVFLSTVMLVYELFLFRMDNLVYYIFQILVRVALWGLSILLLVLQFVSGYPDLFNIIGIALVLIVLWAHAIVIIYATIVGALKLFKAHQEWKKAHSRPQEMVEVEFTVGTGAKRRRVLTLNQAAIVSADRNRENERESDETPESTIFHADQDPLRWKRQKLDGEPNQNRFYYDDQSDGIKQQRFEKNSLQPSNFATLDVPKVPTNLTAENNFQDLTIEYLNQSYGKDGNVSPIDTRRTSLIELQSSKR